jgi:hypothetical protein
MSKSSRMHRDMTSSTAHASNFSNITGREYAGYTRAGNTRALKCTSTCAQRTSFPTDAGYQFRRALLYVRLTLFKIHVIQVVWPFYLVLRIIKEMNHSRRCGYTQLTVNVYTRILMANATHYIPVSEKTVIHSLITSVSLQPPSMNFCVIKNSVMCKHTNIRMRCEIALQVKLYELSVWQFGKQ